MQKVTGLVNESTQSKGCLTPRNSNPFKQRLNNAICHVSLCPAQSLYSCCGLDGRYKKKEATIRQSLSGDTMLCTRTTHMNRDDTHMCANATHVCTDTAHMGIDTAHIHNAIYTYTKTTHMDTDTAHIHKDCTPQH